MKIIDSKSAPSNITGDRYEFGSTHHADAFLQNIPNTEVISGDHFSWQLFPGLNKKNDIKQPKLFNRYQGHYQFCLELIFLISSLIDS